MKHIKSLVHNIHIAGSLSLLSLLFSWFAIVLLLSDSLSASVVMAVIAFLLDSADGFVARKLGRVSEFGRQLDGMIDLINYSLLAALVVWQELLPGITGALVGFLILATGILRLISFNQEGYIEKKGTLYYRGVVTCHLSLLAFVFLVLTQFVEIPTFVITLIMSVAAVLQLSSIPTRKTGALLFWIPVSLVIAVVGIVWL